MKRLCTLFMALLFAINVAKASVPTIESGFRNFDKHFISVLFLTAKGNRSKAREEMQSLLEYWRVFKNNYYNFTNKDARWKNDFDSVEAILFSASKEIETNSALMHVHQKLEKIREIFYELRKRNGIEYYPDVLISFHQKMEAIVHPLSGKKADKLGDSLITKLKSLGKDALDFWKQKVEKRNFNPVDFGFSTEKTKTLLNGIKKEEQILANFLDVVSKKEKDKIIRAGMQIKKGFQKIFLLFSNLKFTKH